MRSINTPAPTFGRLQLATPLLPPRSQVLIENAACSREISFRADLLLLLGFFALILSTVPTRAETPTEAVDRVWNAYAHLDPSRGGDNFPKEFWKLSRQVAQEQGLNVILPLMARFKDWKGAKGLIFVMLMISLPSDQSIPVLEKYKKDGKPWEQQAATDFLIEIKKGYPEELKAMSPAQRKKFLEDTSP